VTQARPLAYQDTITTPPPAHELAGAWVPLNMIFILTRKWKFPEICNFPDPKSYFREITHPYAHTHTHTQIRTIAALDVDTTNIELVQISNW
jgi:hypothetical protein